LHDIHTHALCLLKNANIISDTLKIQISFNYYYSFLHLWLCVIKIIYSFIGYCFNCCKSN